MSSFFQPKSHSRKKDFEFGRILGIGGYGAVKLVTETKTSKEYAVKIVPKTTIRVSSEQQALRLEFLMSLEHPHVIKLQEYFESKERYYLLIFLTTADSYDSSVDLWSLGIILFCLLGGRFPYKAVDSLALAQEASTTRLHFPPHPWDSISKDVKHLISRLLTVNPLKRITAAEALLHPWFESKNIETGSLTPPSEVAKDSSRPSAPSADQIERRPTKREVEVEGGGGAVVGKRATTYIPFDPVIA
ncbi:hypothetical protein RQP46_006966 [Phenoliferia psychrophenolica]